MSDELKPCAHCGSDYEVEEWRHADWTDWRVMCGRCGASTDWYSSREAAIAAWNARANDSLQPESVVSDNRVDANDGNVAQADSREQLEADVRNQAEYSWVTAPHWKVIDWLDRQAAITSRERCYSHDALEEELERVRAERDELKAEIAKYEHDCGLMFDEKRKLTAERDELRRQLNITRDIAREFRDERDALRKKLEAI